MIPPIIRDKIINIYGGMPGSFRFIHNFDHTSILMHETHQRHQAEHFES